MKQITSRENPAVRQYTLLAASRKARMEEQLFVTEGAKLTKEAVQTCSLKELYVTETAIQKYDLDSLGEPVLVSDGVAQKMSLTPAPQGIFGVFHQPQPYEIPLSVSQCYLVLSGLQDPGNVGTILRTAAALGIGNVFLSPDCPDPYSPKVLRASMGGVFRLALETRETAETITALDQARVRVWAAALSPKAVPPQKAGLKAGSAVVIGNEGRGLAPEIAALCKGIIQIPMAPGNESLNAAMAAGILLWEMARETEDSI